MRAVLLLVLTACGRIGFDAVGDVPRACVVELAVGVQHACALLDDGGVWCWGRNDRGQLGTGMVVDAVFRPARVLDGPYAQLASGGDFVCGLRGDDGGVECWGNNGNAQLGPASSGNAGTPVRVTGVVAEEVVAGGAYVCVRQAGNVACWGDNDAGELGTGVVSDKRPQPLPITLADVTVLAAGTDHTCMGTATGVSCWGINNDGQLSVDPSTTTDLCEDNGDSVQPCSLAPVAVAAFSGGVSAIGLGSGFTCALVDGIVQCWGHGTFQELGDGLSTTRMTPAPVANLGDVTAISIGKESGCATLGDATVWCWGEGGQGQLATGTLIDQSAPVVVPALAGATLIDASPNSSARCAVRGDNVVCWGDNQFGIIPDAATITVSEPTVVIPRCP